MSCSAGCYICRPDDPNAPEDGCEGCFEEFIEWYLAAYEEEIGAANDEAGR